jgi:hypothetical protein
MCVLISSTTFVWNISHSKKNWAARYDQKCISVFMWSTVIVVGVWWNLNFLDSFSKNTQISNFMKIRPVGAELFDVGGRTDGWTDMTKLVVALRNFANAPKKLTLIQHRKVPSTIEVTVMISYRIYIAWINNSWLNEVVRKLHSIHAPSPLQTRHINCIQFTHHPRYKHDTQIAFNSRTIPVTNTTHKHPIKI